MGDASRTERGEITPTAEQAAAVKAFLSGGSMVLTAGAGTGKTSTLRLLSESTPTRTGIYLAFNRAIVADARSAFPSNVKVSTSHGLAFQSMGREFQRRINNDVRIPNGLAAERLGISSKLAIGDERNPLTPSTQARYAMDAVLKFCSSDSEAIDATHVAELDGLPDSFRERFAEHVIGHANDVWSDLQDPSGGRFRFHHDVYLKLWSLSRPQLGFDFILYDEAQDSSPVVTSVVNDQLALGAQVVIVGDSAQSIYRWRGAVDAMEEFETDHHLTLTRSFRFGPAIASEANKWLTSIEAPIRLTGTPTISSRVSDCSDAPVDAILCRTNGGTISEVFEALRNGLRPAIVGGANAAIALAKAARELMDRRQTDHRELCLFPSWSAVQKYVADGDAPDLKALVGVIDQYGPEAVIDALERTTDERTADVVISTAHKAKGREWASVRVHSDFPEPYLSGSSGEWVVPSRDERMLAYVAVTRARVALIRGALCWIDTPLTATKGIRQAGARTAGPIVPAPHPRLERAVHSANSAVSPSNAGARWVPSDDQRLLDLYFAGMSRQQLSLELGRKESGIVARLRKALELTGADEMFSTEGRPTLLSRPIRVSPVAAPPSVEVEAASMTLKTLTSVLGVNPCTLRHELKRLDRDRSEPRWGLLWERLEAGATVRITDPTLARLRLVAANARGHENSDPLLKIAVRELAIARKEAIGAELRMIDESAARIAAEKAVAVQIDQQAREVAEAHERAEVVRDVEARARLSTTTSRSVQTVATQPATMRPQHIPKWVRHRRCLHYEASPLATHGERRLIRALEELDGGVVLFGVALSSLKREREVDAIVIHPRGVFTIEQKDLRGPGILAIPTNGPANIDGRVVPAGGMRHQSRLQMQLLAELLKTNPSIEAGYLQALISVHGEVELESATSGSIAITKVGNVVECLNHYMELRPQTVATATAARILGRLEIPVPKI